MRNRTVRRIYVAVAVVALAIPAYDRWSFAREQRVDWFTFSYEATLVPAFYLAAAVLPDAQLPAGTLPYIPWWLDARFYFCVVTAMNVLFWTAVTTLVLLVARLVRRRPVATPSI